MLATCLQLYYNNKMKKINVTFPSGKTIEIDYGTKANSLLEYFSEDKENIIAVKLNNKVKPLDSSIRWDSRIKPVLLASKEGAQIYRHSLCLLLSAANYNLFPSSRLLICHSMGHAYYFTYDDGEPVEEKKIQQLETEMKRLVEADVEISNSSISYEAALSLFEKNMILQARKQLNFSCPPYVRISTLDNFSDSYFGTRLPSTKYLKSFKLTKYDEGFLLRFPASKVPTEIPELEDMPKLFDVYKTYKKWGKRLEVTCAADLNELVNKRKVDDFITITEVLQEKMISAIADKIFERKNVRVVLIAGPSSSGKTTTSKKLELELRAIGYHPKVISLDNYYLGRERTPKDENGNYDYECMEALDVELLNKNLVDLFDGKEVNIPSYNFDTGTPFFDKKNKMRLGKNDILIMEGIHGLNDKLTPLIAPELKFKIYISALTQLNIDDHNRISSSDNRLIRRIVRDSRYRGQKAASTIAMWPSVQRGERLHIFPFQNNADAVLNTALDYELSALKVYAEPLLRCVSPLCDEYSEACRLLNFLSNFLPIPPTEVPDRSIIREFIGGSAFHY